MKKIKKFCVRLFFLTINKITKKKNIVVFAAGVPNGDAIEAVYTEKERLITNKVFYFTKKKETNIEGGIYRNSLKALFIAARAKVFVVNIAFNDIMDGFIPSKKQLVINLRHGVPLKHMGKDINTISKKEIKKELKSAFDNERIRVLVGGRYEERIFNQSCNVQSARFLRLGRTSIDEITRLNHNPNKQILDFKKKYAGLKKVLYCPTFRKNECFKLFPFFDSTIEEFNSFLSKNKITIFLKLHPLHKKEISNLDLSNIIIFDESLTTNEALVSCDCLMTDYSSVFFDFMILRKPMIFVPYDLENYLTTRGLYVKNYFSFVPGNTATSFKELMNCLLTNEVENSKIDYLINEINGYHNETPTAIRVIQYINSILENGDTI